MTKAKLAPGIELRCTDPLFSGQTARPKGACNFRMNARDAALAVDRSGLNEEEKARLLSMLGRNEINMDVLVNMTDQRCSTLIRNCC